MKINNIKIIFFILLVVFLITVCYNRNRRLENFGDGSGNKVNFDKYTEQLAPYIDNYVDPLFDTFFTVHGDLDLRRKVRQYRVLTLAKKSIFDSSDYFETGTDGGGIVIKKPDEDGGNFLNQTRRSLYVNPELEAKLLTPTGSPHSLRKCEDIGLQSLNQEQCNSLHKKWQAWSDDQLHGDVHRDNRNGYGHSLGGNQIGLYYDNVKDKLKNLGAITEPEKKAMGDYWYYLPRKTPIGCSYYNPDYDDTFDNLNSHTRLVFSEGLWAEERTLEGRFYDKPYPMMLLCKDKKLNEFLGLDKDADFNIIQETIETLFEGEGEPKIYTTRGNEFDVNKINLELDKVKTNIGLTDPETALGKQIKKFFETSGSSEPSLELFVINFSKEVAEMIEKQKLKLNSTLDLVSVL